MSLFLLLFVALHVITHAGASDKIYGVNLGNWLVYEPWMNELGWKEMGGEKCGRCSDCIRSEWALTKAYPDRADSLFQKHWETWFTQVDVDKLKEYGINTVRIPLGYWIVESLVDRNTEFYPKGGLLQLKRGLRMLNDAGIKAILVHHALPGVAAKMQEFAGQCTDDVQFYTPENYARALTWTAVMTTLSHVDPDFKAVISIEAVNEPVMNPDETPGLQDYYSQFTQVIRAVELSLGVLDPQTEQDLLKLPGFRNIRADHNLKASLQSLQSNEDISAEVRDAFHAAADILNDLQADRGMESFSVKNGSIKSNGLIVNFMDYLWQHSRGSANGAEAALGSQIYDDHLYLCFGGVSQDETEQGYLEYICNLDRIEKDKRIGQTNVVFGEFSLATKFNASDSFLNDFADAQKYAYSQGAGWIFWNFKTEISDIDHMARQWSYFEGVHLGYFTKDPSRYHNPNICDKYRWNHPRNLITHSTVGNVKPSLHNTN